MPRTHAHPHRCRPLASAGGRHFRIREIGKSRLVNCCNLARSIVPIILFLRRFLEGHRLSMDSSGSCKGR